jgi:hypothetical protein
MNRPRVDRSRRFRWLEAAGAAAGAWSLALLACSGGGGGSTQQAQVDAIQAPPGTMRAVFFEHRAHCLRKAARSSSAEPEVSCNIEIVGTSILEPDRDGRITIDRKLEVAHEESEHPDEWDEQGVELIAYGPNGSAAFATRGWHYFDVWNGKGTPRFVEDARAKNTALSEAERRSFGLEPMAQANETLAEVPPRLRLDLRPFVLDMATMLEAVLLDPALSDASRERISQHLARLDETMRDWGVDWLATRSTS